MKRWLIIACMVAMTAVPNVYADETSPAPKFKMGPKIGWALVLGAVGSYELWAVTTHHETMSQGVQRSRKLGLAVGVGLGALSFHLYWK